MPLVWHIAKKVCQKNGRFQMVGDAVNEGVLGLLEALEKFDAKKGVKFSTYASHRVFGSMMDAIRRDGLIRKSRKSLRSPQIFEISEGDGGSNAEVGSELEKQEFFETLLRGCSQRDRTVIFLRYFKDATAKEAGETVGVCESRASQITKAVFEKIKERYGSFEEASEEV